MFADADIKNKSRVANAHNASNHKFEIYEEDELPAIKNRKKNGRKDGNKRSG